MDVFLVMVCIFVGYLAISWVIDSHNHERNDHG